MPTRGGDGASGRKRQRARPVKRAVPITTEHGYEAERKRRGLYPRGQTPLPVVPPGVEVPHLPVGARKFARDVYKYTQPVEVAKANLRLALANQKALADPSPKNIKKASVLDLEVAKAMALAPYRDVVERNYPMIALDIAALASIGVGSAARGAMATRALREGATVREAARVARIRPRPEQVLPKRLLPDESGLRKIRVEGGEVPVPLQSRNIPTAAMQHALDRFSEQFPGLPGVGAKSRAARRFPEMQAVRQMRMQERAIPFARAARAIQGWRGTTPAEAAYTVVARYGYTGDEGVRLIDMEIGRRRAMLPNLKGKALERQKNRIALLEAAKPLVQNPTAELEAAYTLGKQVSDVTTQMKLEREQKPLEVAQAEAAPAQHIRIIHGAEYVEPSAARAGIESPALKRQRAEVDRLQNLFDKSLAREAKMPKRSAVHAFPEGMPSTAARSPITQRLGAALSVQKDKLARMEAAAARKVEPSGLVGAEGMEPGPLGFFTPDRRQKTFLESLFQRGRSIQHRGERIHSRTGRSFLAAEEQLGPTATLQDYMHEVRLKGMQADTDLAYSFSKPFDEATFDPNRQVILNPKGAKLPESEIAQVGELELEGMTPAEMAQRLLDERTTWVKNTFHRDLGTVPEEHRLGLRVIDKKLARGIQGLDIWQAPAQNLVLKGIDTMNALERSLLVYLNPAYGPVQRTGNYAFLALQQGLPFIGNLPNGAMQINRADKALLDWIDLEVGGGAAASLLHKSYGGPLIHPQEKLADIQNLLADRGPRRQAWIWEAKREGFDGPEGWAQLRDNPDLAPVLDRISERAQQAMVKFRRTPTTTRRALSRVIFILPWIEGSTRWSGRLLLDHPVNARIAAEIQAKIKERQERILKDAKLAVPGFIPIAGGWGVNPTAMSPLSTPTEVFSALGHTAGLLHNPTAAGQELISFLQPTWAGALEAASGINLYGGYKYPESKSRRDILFENLIGTTDRPASGLAATIKTALGGTGSPEGVYQQEQGIQDALLRGFLGSARPRTPNMEIATQRGRERQRLFMDKVGRAREDGREYLKERANQMRTLGAGPVPPEVRQAIQLRTQRNVAYARDKAKTQKEKFLSDVRLLVDQGKLGPDAIDTANTFLEANPTDSQIEHQRDLLGNTFFGAAILSDFNAKLRQGLEAQGLNP